METIESNNKFVSDTSTGDNYGKGWNLIFITFIELLVVTLVYAVIQMPTGGIQIKPEGFEWYQGGPARQPEGPERYQEAPARQPEGFERYQKGPAR